MTNFAEDREIERHRYSERATNILAIDDRQLGSDGAESVDRVLREPYLAYEELIRCHARPGVSVLDLCCGDGVHSLIAARAGAQVTASDLVENNLALVRRRAARAGLPVQTLAADAEQIPCCDCSFDVVTCAGGMSYVDLGNFIRETRRLLRPGGALIFVDSLNHNPVYRFNRYVHYLRGRRSRATLMRMPTVGTLERIRTAYPDLALSFHGIFSFLAPVLCRAGRERAARWLDSCDRACVPLKRYAFKIVGAGHRPPE